MRKLAISVTLALTLLGVIGSNGILVPLHHAVPHLVRVGDEGEPPVTG